MIIQKEINTFTEVLRICYDSPSFCVLEVIMKYDKENEFMDILENFCAMCQCIPTEETLRKFIWCSEEYIFDKLNIK